ncbi:exodeoxyribonuclease VII large subunit [Undibacterium umbellatum]|uniref:Exodeoxyribonuclease 7 large subunit n=1 Tax=Undibacterium umbellatum TaxID=2762300 RepID=A0ABR6ZH39_9BURK|nr:exodeoxyribonuclease VII large subunit [Undibacterium umbellatum]MBC3910989.1 exodeoxyribonuclease VII large subunit [Undibacterium umbellatum]
MNPESPYTTPVNTPPVITVTALNQAVAQLLERNLPLTWVSGEISNFTRAASGHWYFTLKDSGAQVRAVMFRGRAQYADFQPKEGDKVEVRALVTLYAPRGDYQLSVEAIRRAGVGNLYEAFLRLKAQLTQEGLFDPERKRPLPAFVKTIGIVTSPQAAALRDILIALHRRAPHVHIILYPTPVQGEGAGMKIAQAIASAAAREECDVLLVCRGGGSMEDLWAFNEEVVARTIVNCPMPVIAGIGHETDFTIADFAADLRAATPTAAAELAAAPRDAWLQLLQRQVQILSRCMHRQLDDQAQTLDWQSRRLLSPKAAIAARRLQLASLARNLSHSASLPILQARHELMQLTQSWQAHKPDLAKPRLLLADMQRRLQQARRRHQEGRQQQLSALRGQLELLNPQRTLERGYAILSDHKGKALRNTAELKPQSLLQVRLASGTAEVGISSVQTKLD